MKKPTGRPKGPVNARERAARRVASFKHGGRAKGAGQFLRPCKSDACPLTWKCDVRQARDADGLATTYCLIDQAEPVAVERMAEIFGKAVAGDRAELVEMTNQRLALLAAIFDQEAQRLLSEGASIPVYARDEDGDLVMQDGHPVAIGFAFNRGRLEAVQTLAARLGLDAAAQLMTPGSRKETAAIDQDGVLEDMRRGRAALKVLQGGKGAG